MSSPLKKPEPSKKSSTENAKTATASGQLDEQHQESEPKLQLQHQLRPQHLVPAKMQPRRSRDQELSNQAELQLPKQDKSKEAQEDHSGDFEKEFRQFLTKQSQGATKGSKGRVANYLQHSQSKQNEIQQKQLQHDVMQRKILQLNAMHHKKLLNDKMQQKKLQHDEKKPKHHDSLSKKLQHDELQQNELQQIELQRNELQHIELQQKEKQLRENREGHTLNGGGLQIQTNETHPLSTLSLKRRFPREERNEKLDALKRLRLQRMQLAEKSKLTEKQSTMTTTPREERSTNLQLQLQEIDPESSEKLQYQKGFGKQPALNKPLALREAHLQQQNSSFAPDQVLLQPQHLHKQCGSQFQVHGQYMQPHNATVSRQYPHQSTTKESSRTEPRLLQTVSMQQIRSEVPQPRPVYLKPFMGNSMSSSHSGEVLKPIHELEQQLQLKLHQKCLLLEQQNKQLQMELEQKSKSLLQPGWQLHNPSVPREETEKQLQLHLQNCSTRQPSQGNSQDQSEQHMQLHFHQQRDLRGGVSKLQMQQKAHFLEQQDQQGPITSATRHMEKRYTQPETNLLEQGGQNTLSKSQMEKQRNQLETNLFEQQGQNNFATREMEEQCIQPKTNVLEQTKQLGPFYIASYPNEKQSTTQQTRNKQVSEPDKKLQFHPKHPPGVKEPWSELKKLLTSSFTKSTIQQLQLSLKNKKPPKLPQEQRHELTQVQQSQSCTENVLTQTGCQTEDQGAQQLQTAVATVEHELQTGVATVEEELPTELLSSMSLVRVTQILFDRKG